MLTVLAECEAAVNSRPLTCSAEEDPLTPQHFLRGHFIDVPLDTSGEPVLSGLSLKEFQVQASSLSHSFWTRWSRNYLTNLPKCVQNNNHIKPSIQVGDLCLIRDEPPRPRLQWPLAKVEKLYQGRDGLTRAVRVKTQMGTYDRCITRLHRLELDCGTTPPEEVEPEQPPPEEVEPEQPPEELEENNTPTDGLLRTRTGRAIRAPKKFCDF